MNVPIIGVVENMSYFKCGNCGQEHEIFKRIAGADRDGAAPTSTFYDADGRGAEGGAAEGPGRGLEKGRGGAGPTPALRGAGRARTAGSGRVVGRKRGTGKGKERTSGARRATMQTG